MGGDGLAKEVDISPNGRWEIRRQLARTGMGRRLLHRIALKSEKYEVTAQVRRVYGPHCGNNVIENPVIGR